LPDLAGDLPTIFSLRHGLPTFTLAAMRLLAQALILTSVDAFAAGVGHCFPLPASTARYPTQRCPGAALAMPEPDEGRWEDSAARVDETSLSDILAARSFPNDDAGIETDVQVLLDAGRVWALLFNPGSDEEGIYSRRLGMTNLVLTFEEEDDAERYAEMLVATDFPSAAPVEVSSATLVEFCHEGGHMIGLVRAGSLIMPPDETVEEFDWAPGSARTAEVEAIGMAQDELDASRASLEALFGLKASDGDATDEAAR